MRPNVVNVLVPNCLNFTFRFECAKHSNCVCVCACFFHVHSSTQVLEPLVTELLNSIYTNFYDQSKPHSVMEFFSIPTYFDRLEECSDMLDDVSLALHSNANAKLHLFGIKYTLLPSTCINECLRFYS